MTLGALADFTKRFNGRRWDIPGNEQVAEVCPCERHQGLNSIIQYYRNNSSLDRNWMKMILGFFFGGVLLPK